MSFGTLSKLFENFSDKHVIKAIAREFNLLQNHIHPGNDFKQQLKSLLKAHPNVDVAAVGFPDGWQNEPLWK